MARDTHGAFTESDGTSVGERQFNFGQFRIGGELAYGWDAWEPFVSALYQYDFEREDLVVAGAAQPANDNDDVNLGVGIRYFGTGGINGSLEYTTIVGREDFEADTITFSVRAEF